MKINLYCMSEPLNKLHITFPDYGYIHNNNNNFKYNPYTQRV